MAVNAKMDASLLVEELVARQRTHPATDGFSPAAKIGELSLHIGSAATFEDTAYLAQHGISAAVSLGTGNIAPQSFDVHTVDILDMEHELIIVHFQACLDFLRKHVLENKRGVLVHCVYGQSRSATICVAFLMATQQMSLQAAFDAVQHARPCIYINPGFLRQLQLFERMGCNADLLGNTPAHAVCRTLVVTKQRTDHGSAEFFDLPVDPTQPSLHCRKCSMLLCTAPSELIHGKQLPNGRSVCEFVHLEPLQWMAATAPSLMFSSQGKLLCPRPACKAKLGSWHWHGIKYAFNQYISTSAFY
ncbi:TPA: hypothetical protein N0F65_008497 [Lagenidium giganteum]|uniref:protein-tyrosine-phosphatase n=1 Tax=Lagenidium giganteum TaxID=4803 RepID=A0AAV2Z645_9STRA|nr:TPA: hypothetical protein N0F65_008497 [Lagenidium giganteum]